MQLDQLVAKFQQKDYDSFQKLYNMYSESMHGVIFNIVRNKEVAEEVLQDAFIKAWNNAESYSPKKGRIFTWLLNISRNAAIDKTRSKNFKKSKQNSDATFFVDILEDHDNLDAQTNAIGIRKFVDELKDQCKKLIELIYFKGFTQKETSETMNIPLGTVKTNNRKCISQLRKIVLT